MVKSLKFLWGASNIHNGKKNCDFRQITRYFSKTVQERHNLYKTSIKIINIDNVLKWYNLKIDIVSME